MSKSVKRTGTIVLVVMMCFLLVACGTGPKGKQAGESAEQAVKNYLEAVKKKDQNTKSQYLEGSDSLGDSTEAYEEMPELEDKIVDFDYKILSSEEQEDQAVVLVEITTYDFKTFFSKVIEDMFAKASEITLSEGAEIDEDAMMNEIIEDNLSLLQSKNTTIEAEIELNKHEDGWKIKDSDSVANAVLNGALDMLQDASGDFSGE